MTLDQIQLGIVTLLLIFIWNKLDDVIEVLEEISEKLGEKE